MGMRLRRKRDCGADLQRKTFEERVSELAPARYWREAGVVAGMTYDEFRRTVKLRNYEALVPAIEQMQRGEPDVLAPGQCSFFALSSGTGGGAQKVLPVTAPMLAHFRAACRDALLYYTARVGHAGVFRGRHLFLTGSTALRPIGDPATHRAFVGDWPAIAALNLPDWAENHFYEPGAPIADIADWQAKVDAVIARTRGVDITLLAGIPPWIVSFAETMRAKCGHDGQPLENLHAIWPNLECVVHGGVPIAPYLGELKALLGPGVHFHEVYGSSEGVFGAQDSDTPGELRLMCDTGVLFEFLPLAEYDEAKLDSLGDRTLAVGDTAVGVDYVVIVTTPAGLARYVLGDVVRFTSVQPHRFTYCGRVGLRLSAFGENLLERDVTEALMAICQRHRWTIVNFHVAPLFTAALTGQARGRHEWWVELRPGTVETPTGPSMAVELDAELQRTNRAYAERRASGRIDAPTVRLVMPGVFRHWLRFHGKWGGQSKIARCRSDRLMADELAQITRFAHD